jgi:hypothetical protein
MSVWEGFEITATARIVIHDGVVEIVVRYGDAKTEFIPVASAVIVADGCEVDVRAVGKSEAEAMI